MTIHKITYAHMLENHIAEHNPVIFPGTYHSCQTAPKKSDINDQK